MRYAAAARRMCSLPTMLWSSKGKARRSWRNVGPSFATVSLQRANLRDQVRGVRKDEPSAPSTVGRGGAPRVGTVRSAPHHKNEASLTNPAGRLRANRVGSLSALYRHCLGVPPLVTGFLLQSSTNS